MCEELIRVKYTDYGNTADVKQHFTLERVEEIQEEDLLANLLDVRLVSSIALATTARYIGKYCRFQVKALYSLLKGPK